MQELRKKFDSGNLFSIINNLPNQFAQAFDEVDAKIDSTTAKIVFSGMGGSALPANILKTYLCVIKSDFNIPIKINRDYSLPSVVDENWCGFFDSYSGNTEETLSALADAEKRGLKQIIILAHGAKLEEIAKEKGYQFVKLPETNQPRMAYGYVVGAMLKIFVNSDLLDLNFDELKSDIEKAIQAQSKIDQQAQELAQSLENKIPLIYASNQWKYLAMVWKINFNENAKVQSFWNALPEANHNEMVGFTNLMADYKLMILKDPNDNQKIIKRMQVLENLLSKKMPVEIIEMQTGSEFFKLITTLNLGLLTSYYLALLNKIDPAPVEMVEKFKKML